MSANALQAMLDGIELKIPVRVFDEHVPAEVPDGLGPNLRIIRRGGYWFVFHWPEPWTDIAERLAGEIIAAMLTSRASQQPPTGGCEFCGFPENRPAAGNYTCPYCRTPWQQR